ncbi:MAG TPA: hypothetical protein VKU35_05755 [Candidatus Limnocylindria bacterium]|nr:hypothetical protein [Candidatus Limnocylindria bacterium]
MTNPPPEPAATPPAIDAPATAPAPVAASTSFAPPPAFVAPVIPTRRQASLLTTVLLVGAAAIAVAGISFAVGRITAPVAAASTFTGRRLPGIGNGSANDNGNGGRTFRSGAFGGIGIRGTVTAVNGSTITVRLANGQQIQVQTDSSTTYHQQASGSASDVTSGKSVIVEVQPGAGGFGTGTGANGTTRTITASDITVAGQ